MHLENLIKKRQEHIHSCRENNDNSHEIIAGLYSDSTHFIYELLQNADFFRVHKSFLVNLIHIVEIIKTGDIIITGGTEIPIAKENIKPLIQLLSNFH